MANAEEYDPMEAEDADDDDDDGNVLFLFYRNVTQYKLGQGWKIMHHAECVMDKISTVSETISMRINLIIFMFLPLTAIKHTK